MSTLGQQGAGGGRRKRGYYNAPNADIPLNNRQAGEVAPVAFDQLRPYQEAADQWPMHSAWHKANEDMDMPAMFGMECRFCGQFIWAIQDENSAPYQYEPGVTKALTVAHIRRQHQEKVMINEQGHCEILDTPLSNDFGG